jgi:hypothetical protein
MWEIVVHKKDKASMLVTRCRLPGGRVVKADVVPLAEMLMGKDVGVSMLGHVGRMGSPDLYLAGVTILVG